MTLESLNSMSQLNRLLHVRCSKLSSLGHPILYLISLKVLICPLSNFGPCSIHFVHIYTNFASKQRQILLNDTGL